jgi:hypothetical protein
LLVDSQYLCPLSADFQAGLLGFLSKFVKFCLGVLLFAGKKVYIISNI